MRFDSVPAADVKAEIDAAVAYFDHRPIRDFVPPTRRSANVAAHQCDSCRIGGSFGSVNRCPLARAAVVDRRRRAAEVSPSGMRRPRLIGACGYDAATAAVPTWLASSDRPIVWLPPRHSRPIETLGITVMRALAAEPVHVVATFPAGVPVDVP
jgi:hypothetical protein